MGAGQRQERLDSLYSVMSLNKAEKKGPASGYTIPGTRVANRAEIFDDQDEIMNEQAESDSKKMDMLMRQLMGTPDINDAASDEAGNESEEQKEEEEEEEAFVFRLFSSNPVAQVNIKENEEEDAKRLAEMVAELAKQRSFDHDDENDPEFMARIADASVNYDTIMTQSHWAYPAMRYPRRVMNISAEQEQEAEEKKAKRKRKSKKCRDFEKAVREGRIKPLPNKRDPSTPGGWPGWPGNRTRYAIITDVSKILKKKPFTSGSRGRPSRGRGGARGGGQMRGRGGRGRGSMQKRP